MLLTIILLPLVLGTLLSLALGERSRITTAAAAFAIAGASFGLLLSAAPEVFAGGVITQRWQWVPEIGLDITLRLDGLALMFGLLISGIGLLIITYAHFYLGASDSVRKFFSEILLFMAAMLGIVLSDNLLLLIVFWELTSLSSFLLVGYWSHKAEARAGARMALAVTGGGGLAMLGGFILLGNIAGTYEISQMLALAPQIQADPAFVPALLLILLGCFTKSAQFPFHFWLPQAMAAPTPVSAYLHSATMVKAGIFLLLRLSPVIADPVWFHGIVTTAGLVTVVFAAFIAIFKHDLKGLLAYSTVSHLGLVTFLIGLGSPLAIIAAIFHILNHASFKGACFMLAGIIDHETGTRDQRLLGKLWPLMPFTGTLLLIASASMAGIPLTNGFLSKEMFFTEAVTVFQDGGTWLIPVGVTIAGICSVAYSLRLVHDSFFNGPQGKLPNPKPHEPPFGMRLPATLLAIVCVAVGLFPMALLGPMVELAAAAASPLPLPEFKISIWHGFNLPLLMSAIALVGGVAIYARLMTKQRLHHIDADAWFKGLSGKALFDRSIEGIFALAGRLNSALENGSLQRYAGWTLAAAIVGAAFVLIPGEITSGDRALAPATPLAYALWFMLAFTCVWLVTRHHQRFKAVILVGVIGLVTSLTFASLSAPDLALTQLSVEVVSTVLLLMGLALLPQQTPKESSVTRKARDAVLALTSGAGVSWIAWMMMTRSHDSISWYFLNESLPKGGGTNIVNVILVDFRGYDTYGEITVLGIAAIGVLALMEGFRTRRPKADPQGLAWTFADQPLMLRVAASIALPMALVVSLYIFFRGHNMPGGGFIAGLITSVALVLQFMAMGQRRSELLLRADGGERFVRWIGYGLTIAGLTGVGAMVIGRPFLTSAHGHPAVPLLGEIPLATAAIFDLGVYLTVVGSTMLTISVLGGVSPKTSQTQPSEAKPADLAKVTP